MKWLLPLAIVLLGVPGFACAQADSEMFTVYLARHAEKNLSPENLDDPPLSFCGGQRAEALARILREVKLERVFSTPFQRTRDTALPSASAHGLEIEDYDPADLDGFSTELLKNQQNALVIGHSNTTAVLAGLLIGEAGEEFEEDEYDRLYLVTVAGAQNQLILLDQAFRCDGW